MKSSWLEVPKAILPLVMTFGLFGYMVGCDQTLLEKYHRMNVQLTADLQKRADIQRQFSKEIENLRQRFEDFERDKPKVIYRVPFKPEGQSI